MKSYIALLYLMAFAGFPVSPADALSRESQKMELRWEVGFSSSAIEQPDHWIPATVPGAVQLDFARAKGYGTYWWGDNFLDYTWMESKFFTYRASFQRPDVQEGHSLYFISMGIDYKFEIYLNRQKIHEQEGMFTPVQIDLSGHLKTNNTLEIIVHPPPEMGGFAGAHPASTAKPAVSWGWDWHPRLIPLGIWDETYLELRPDSHLDDIWVDYTLDSALSLADIRLHVEGSGLQNCSLLWRLEDREGRLVASLHASLEKDHSILYSLLEKPKLWWPHDHGDPYLYRSVAELNSPDGKLLDRHFSYIGFRKVRLVMAETTWYDPPGYPNTRNVAPFQLEINHRRIFAKGSNWVNPEIFPGIITEYRYSELIDRALEANFNILRVWGGGIVNKRSFFELCDKAGILVWQDFPLSCYNYVDDPVYLDVLKQESASIIRKVRKHPCLALWCGGNELLNTWSRMTDQSLALRLLNSQCLIMDPGTPYIPSSPIEGVAHGAYVFRDQGGEEVFQRMIRINAQRQKFTAYPEFGVPSPSSVEVLKTFMPEEELWPPEPGGVWESHHGFRAWGGDPSSWLMKEQIEDYFGISHNLEELVSNGQLLQSEGYKAGFEGARRQKPYCSMALNWCFNEPWPTAANNSLINWPNHPKQAFYAVGRSCRPFLASAEITRMKWREGDQFRADIWILNDLPHPSEPGRLNVKILVKGEEIFLLSWEFGELKANENLKGPEAEFTLPELGADRFELVVEVEDHPEFSSNYTLLFEAN